MRSALADRERFTVSTFGLDPEGLVRRLVGVGSGGAQRGVELYQTPREGREM